MASSFDKLRMRDFLWWEMPRKHYPHAEPLIPSLSRDEARRAAMQPLPLC